MYDIQNHLFHIFEKLSIFSRVRVILFVASKTKRMQIAGVKGEEHPDEVADGSPAA
jgi:hypothetical protein